MSSFVTKVINEALEKEKELLRKAYIEADADPDRAEVLADWNALDTESWE